MVAVYDFDQDGIRNKIYAVRGWQLTACRFPCFQRLVAFCYDGPEASRV